jgi:hypothetical protein
VFRKPAPRDDDGRPVSRRVRTLTTQLTEAHDVHRLATDPLLGAVTADRFRTSITRTMWVFLTIGLGFTTTGVHDFLAGDRSPSDPLWWGAWLAEPALAGILVTLLRWEAAMLTAGITVTDKPVKHLKRLLLGATLIANVWAGLAPAHGGISTGMVFFHLVIPLVVFLLAEVMPIIQQRCTQAREHALAATPPTVTTSPDRAVRPVAAATVPGKVLTKLPAGIRDTVTTTTADAHAKGRPVTADDLTTRVALPDAMLTALVNELNATVNHHPVTT